MENLSCSFPETMRRIRTRTIQTAITAYFDRYDSLQISPGAHEAQLRGRWVRCQVGKAGARSQRLNRIIQANSQLGKSQVEETPLPESLNIPTLLNTTPYTRSKRQFFYKDAAAGLEAALEDGRAMTLDATKPDSVQALRGNFGSVVMNSS